jgi:hypothetical protein
MLSSPEGLNYSVEKAKHSGFVQKLVR